MRLLGRVDQVETVLRESDVLAFPSHLNGPGRAVFEAGMHGIPAIVALKDRVEDVVEDGVTGLIVPPRDPRRLADAVLRLADDPTLRRRLGDAARAALHGPVRPRPRGAADDRGVPRAGPVSTFLVLTQVYVPDPAAVGQHMADAAAELVRRGHRVIVLTSDRGYDDPGVRYPRREIIDGVEVRRIPFTSFGKSSIAMRLLGGGSFTLQAILRSLGIRPLDAILVSTAPPMASVAAVVIAALRRVPIKYWVMDLNPDQLVALGIVRETSLVARVFDRLNRMVLRRAIGRGRPRPVHGAAGESEARRQRQDDHHPAVAPRGPPRGDPARGQSVPPPARA